MIHLVLILLNNMKKKIIKLILGSSTGLIICGFLILIPLLMIYNFFGGEISDSGYIEGNIEYASEYQKILNENITKNNNGYIPLSRIIYFYYLDSDLEFSDIYKNNLDLELKNMKPISEVCNEFYSNLDSCKDEEYDTQLDDYPYKPFVAPIIFSGTTITSYFGQERIVYDEYDVHYAWDFASPAGTPVYSVGDGTVSVVRFNQSKNEIDTTNGAGNYIEIEYEVENEIYKVIYGHLYPNSSLVKVGDQVHTGQKIAEVGTTGYSTGNHLHWQVSKNGNKIDGMNLVDFNQEINYRYDVQDRFTIK